MGTYVACPEFRRPHGLDGALIRDAEHLLAHVRKPAASRTVRASVDAWLEEYGRRRGRYLQPFPALLHRLSPHVPIELLALSQPLPKTPRERDVLASKRRHFTALRRRPSLARFKDLLCEIADAAGAGTSTFRTQPVGTVRDALGDFTVYPSHDLIGRQLARAHQCIFANNGLGHVGTALTALVAILAIHPFSDGNGRVARITFHGLMGVPPDAYMPLHEFAAVSRAGYLLSLREASYFQQWAPIATYIWQSARLCWGRRTLCSAAFPTA